VDEIDGVEPVKKEGFGLTAADSETILFARKMKREVRRYPNLEHLSTAAAEFICSLANERVDGSGLLTIVLAGGKTPKTLYENLALPFYSTRMPWSHIHLFWGDERCVLPDHPESNFAMAFHALISKVPLPSQNVHRMPAEIEPPEDAAEAYEDVLREFFGFPRKPGPIPAFDLIVLGVGKDGHTASLFPGDRALEMDKRWVTAVQTPRGTPLVPRITLTLPLINGASCVLFMVSGSGKRELVRSILEEPDSAAQRYPAARVSPGGRTIWLIDEETT
jgi:6-phosphogluconolactonase